MIDDTLLYIIGLSIVAFCLLVVLPWVAKKT
jgi:type III secretory pathway component EscS